MFRSLPKFIAALHRSDEFDGEYFENVSQTKSEKERQEKIRKKSADQQELMKKIEKEDINEMIERRMQKYKDFVGLKKPGCTKKETVIRSEGDLPSHNSSLE